MNKHIGIKVKSRIYKTATRPIMTYTAEIRTETSETKIILETTEMKIVRRIAGKMLTNRERSSEDIRQSCMAVRKNSEGNKGLVAIRTKRRRKR